MRAIETIQAEGRRCVSITVIGEPAPQGSKRHVGKGHMIESSAKVKPWREAVAWAAKRDMKGGDLFEGPLHVVVTFHMPQTTKDVRRGLVHVIGRNDLEKLLRSTFDAMTGIVWRDDAQVAIVEARKQWAQSAPGADISVSER